MITYCRQGFYDILQETGSLGIFSVRATKVFLTTRGNFRPIMAQVASVSLRTLSTVIFAGIFVGAILVLQLNLILSRYDAQSFLGGLNTSTVVREVGPLIISFLLAGKIGAFTAAELGTMRVTEQIEAIECLGTNPFQYLIVPRFIGIMLASLILLFIGLMVSIAGAMVVASVSCGINFLEFSSSISRFTSGWTIVAAMIKSLIYGSIVGAVSCHKGFTASGGARGVGRAVTLAAVYTNFYIVIANFVTSNLLGFISDMAQTYHGITP
jgi:phospholipid/cholesterol/gamma-HCH transport system permease protein